MKIGIVGLGDMGKMFAKIWSENSDNEVFGSDLEENIPTLKKELSEYKISIKPNAEVCALADFLLFCVEAENIGKVVKSCAQFIKKSTIISGQTSVKYVEKKAFDEFLPSGTEIITAHSLHGPAVSPKGQTMLLINISAGEQTYHKVYDLYKSIGSKIVELTNIDQHDKMMADVQAITHIGFESIGTTWMRRKSYPWETDETQNILDHIKLAITLRIYSYKSHVYSGLSLLNPHARADARVYADAESDLFEMMICEEESSFRKLIYEARDFVFHKKPTELILNEAVLAKVGKLKPAKANSHLSLLAMVVTWYRLGVRPADYEIVQTPPFKLRVGMAEYLFLNEDLLEETIQAALYDKSLRADDLAFHSSVHEWVNIVAYKDKKGYDEHFLKTKNFLSDRLEKGKQESSDLIAALKKD